jgi:hypothetical protein
VIKADGVFLWVTLVVKSLLSGLGNHDGIKDLQRCLRLLQGDLESLYARMLSRIDPFYQEKASKMFQLIRASRDYIPMYHDDSFRPMTLFALALADEDDDELAMSTRIKLWEVGQIQERCEIMAARLKCRCAGLLEIQEFDPTSQGALGTHGRPTLQDLYHRTRTVFTRNVMPTIRASSKVEYLHRTVRDYLEKPDIWSQILAHTSSSTFNANRDILSRCILHMKTSITSNQSQKLWYMSLDAMTYARLADEESAISNATLLEQLDTSMSALYRPQLGGHWSSNSPSNKPGSVTETWNSNILSFAVQLGLTAYGKEILDIDSKVCTQKKGRPFIAYALCPMPVTEDYPANSKVVALLRDYCPESVLHDGPNHVLKDAAVFQWNKWEELALTLNRSSTQESRAQTTSQICQSFGVDSVWEHERVEMFRLLLEHHYMVSPHPQNGVPCCPQPPSVHDIIESFRNGLPPKSVQALISAVPPSQTSVIPVPIPQPAFENKRQNKPSILRRLKWIWSRKMS